MITWTAGPTQAIGVDGGTETWRADPDGRWPMCGCDTPDLGPTESDGVLCLECGLPNVAALTDRAKRLSERNPDDRV